MTYALCGIVALIGVAGSVKLWRTSFFWAGGLLIGALAVLAYAGAMAGNDVAFRLYYALGASIFPGWIGAGSLRVAFGRKLARWPGMLVILFSAVQLALTLPAGVDVGALAGLNGGNGAGVLTPGVWVAPTVLFNTFGLGFAAVAAFFAWWRAFRVQRPELAAQAIGLSLVALGVLARSDAVYKMLSAVAGPTWFMVCDLAAFGLVWLGASVTDRLPGPLARLLFGPAFTAEGAQPTPALP